MATSTFASAPEWPFRPGQKVRVAPGPDWRSDWQGVVLEVVGVRVESTGIVRVHVSEDWPRDGGVDDMRADDLVPA